jgi:uncharacterized membrane protein YesL
MFSLIRETLSFIMANLFDITLVSLAWLALQLPVVTGPAATVALYHFARQAVLQDEAQFKDFPQGLRKYFWKGWLIVLPYVLLLLLIGYDIAFFLSAEQPASRLWASAPMAVLSIVLVAQSYVFVFFVRESGAVRLAVKRALLLAAAHLVFTMALLLLTLLLFLGLYVTKIGLALVFVGPVAVLQTKAVQYLLKKRGIEL